MDKSELERKLAAIPEEAPDEVDLAMIAAAEKENDGTTIPLEEFKRRMECSGKISLRLPRSLHARLIEEAREDGISLNQYILYKLSSK